MCGIAGYWGDLAADPAAPRILTRMTLALRHRGPDGQKEWRGPNVGLGHTRLAIIDAEGGAQPMMSVDGRYIVSFNGEIYNFQELKRDLEALGYGFRTRSDTEVIWAAVDAWGIERGLRNLRGMFAFALYNTQTRSLLLARDRVGIKPLFWAQTTNTVLFASEPKAILETGIVTLQMDPVAVHDYLAHGYAGTPRTCWAGIQQLEPGTWLEFTTEGRKCGRYWEWRPVETYEGTEEQATDSLRGTLTESIRCHLISDVPVGTFLSGGLDSSLVTALLSRELAPQASTFSMGFGDPDYDETGAARSVASYCKTAHHEMRMEAGVGDPDLLRSVVEQYDEPFGDSSSIPTYLMCREVRKHVKVVLSGDGGDEVLGGYLRYLNARRLEIASHLNGMLPLLAPVMRFGAAHLGRIGARTAKAWGLAKMTQVERLCALQTYFDESERQALYRPEYAELAFASGATSVRFAGLVPAEGDAAQRMIAAEMRLRLHADYLRKVDVASSAHGLEVRVPFLDNAMLDFAAALPIGMKLSMGGSTKILARRLAQQLLPRDISTRSKQGFSLPLDHWAGPPMRAYLRDLLLSSQSRTRSILDSHSVAQIWNAFDRPAETPGPSRYQRYQRVFLLAALEIWMRRWNPSVP